MQNFRSLGPIEKGDEMSQRLRFHERARDALAKWRLAAWSKDPGAPRCGSKPDWGDAHKRVWEHFEGASDRYRREIGQTGRRLKFQRIKADYRGAEVISRTDVTSSIDRAQRILTRLGQLVN